MNKMNIYKFVDALNEAVDWFVRISTMNENLKKSENTFLVWLVMFIKEELPEEWINELIKMLRE